MFCCEIWDWDGLVEVRDVPYRYDTWPPWKLMMCKGVPRFILVITRDLILQTRQSYFTIYSQRKMLLGVWSRARWCDRENQFSSVAQSRPTLCDPMNHSTPGLPVHHQLPEFTQTHAHRVSDAIQASHPLSPPSPPAPSPSQHQGLLQWVSSSHQVAKELEFQPQHQSFQRTPRTDLL